jgi:chemotaxis signal transduction protein
MTDGAGLTGRAEHLRRAFDRAFSEAPSTAAVLTEDFLAVQAGATAYAVRLAEIAGLSADRPIQPLPGPVPEFLGLVGIRGSLLAVYDLAGLLGHPAAGAAGRWLLLTGTTPVIAVAVTAFEGHLRVSRRDVSRAEGFAATAGRGPHLAGVVRVDDAVRPIINLASVVDALARRVRDAAALKES